MAGKWEEQKQVQLFHIPLMQKKHDCFHLSIGDLSIFQLPSGLLQNSRTKAVMERGLELGYQPTHRCSLALLSPLLCFGSLNSRRASSLSSSVTLSSKTGLQLVFACLHLGCSSRCAAYYRQCLQLILT